MTPSITFGCCKNSLASAYPCRRGCTCTTTFQGLRFVLLRVHALLVSLQSTCHREAALRAYVCKRMSLPADCISNDFRLTSSQLAVARYVAPCA